MTFKLRTWNCSNPKSSIWTISSYEVSYVSSFAILGDRSAKFCAMYRLLWSRCRTTIFKLCLFCSIQSGLTPMCLAWHFCCCFCCIGVGARKSVVRTTQNNHWRKEEKWGRRKLNGNYLIARHRRSYNRSRNTYNIQTSTLYCSFVQSATFFFPPPKLIR